MPKFAFSILVLSFTFAVHATPCTDSKNLLIDAAEDLAIIVRNCFGKEDLFKYMSIARNNWHSCKRTCIEKAQKISLETCEIAYELAQTRAENYSIGCPSR